MKKFRRLYPHTIYGQMVMLVSLSMILTLSVISFLLYQFRPVMPPVPPGPWANAQAMETGIQALQAAPLATREAIAKKISNSEITFSVTVPLPCEEVPVDHLAELLHRILLSRLDMSERQIQLKSCAPDESGRPSSYIYVPEGTISIRAYNFPHIHFHHFMHLTTPLMVSFLSLLSITLSLTFWSIWYISRPLRNIAKGADAFGYDIAPDPLPEQGPTEVKRLTRAFNRMQARIAASVEERTRMLIAIGHDLRTPLTRLFMRLEIGGEEASPQALHHDLTLMNKMLNGALYFLREQTEAEKPERTDLASLLESLSMEYSAVGRNVTYKGPSDLICVCQTTALERALSNLVDNGLKYGSEVSIHLESDTRHAIITICDDGPGIPDAQLPSALLPFYRLDPARASDGGLGLGLSIAEAIVSRHQGKLVLSNVKPHGLQAQIILPLHNSKLTA
ncbi:ATP-binding protein [Acetobacter indonesiensis]|uniref:ATP-binding protein n=1 Tax=Acetobacter indonesiensis TaxID=104101 RepID=UPI001F44C10C|nr:ATP-binding protein [Acetobacter indonesiensis]MCG0996453.1 ATP-binding protein [Acetobacter indonesiensis]